MDVIAFTENVKSYCKKLRVSPTVACEASGAGRNLLTNLKKGENPSIDRVQLLATYLGCTIGELLGEKEKPTPVSESELSDKDARLLAWFHSLPPEKRQAILTVGDGPEGLA